LKYFHLEERIAHRKAKVQLSPVSIRPIDLTVKKYCTGSVRFYLAGGGKMRTEGSGFSLIEILIVMGVLSILAIVFTI
jgi:prepilin-type N-terminal cleavage/methylation domain-containing protein